MVVAVLLVSDLSLFCDAFQVVSTLVVLGAPLSQYAFRKLGSLVLGVGLDTCYAFNAIANGEYATACLLLAAKQWFSRKSIADALPDLLFPRATCC